MTEATTIKTVPLFADSDPAAARDSPPEKVPSPQVVRQSRGRTGLPAGDPCPAEPWDDLGAGLRFGELYRNRVRYIPERREWLIWDGARWAVDKSKQVNRYAAAVGRKMRVWAARIEDDGKRKKAAKAAEYACQSGGQAAMLSMASALEWVATPTEMFDQHPDLLNCRNGTVDLRTGELLPHDPQHLLTMTTGVDYTPGVTHPDWGVALSAVRPECIRWLRTRIGQAATGHPPDDDVMVFARGTGENGKSTLFIGVHHSLGDYSRMISERALMADPKAHPTELMEFRGARFAFTEELPEGGRLNVARLKKIVGTPMMTARAIRRDSETWTATHSMFLGTNHLPIVDDVDWGTWRRVLLLDFPYKFLKAGAEPAAAHERIGDPGLKMRLQRGKAQHETILAWIVEGARVWYESGCVMPSPPAAVVADTDMWRGRSDLILAYWSERLRPEPSAMVWQREMYEDFSAWLREHGQAEWSNRLFLERFRQHDRTAAAHLMERRAKSHGGRALSRRPGAMTALPTAIDAWLGLRFADPNESLPDD